MAGGSGSLESDNSIEYLVINDSFRSNQWQVCTDKLPAGLHGHQLNILNNKLILTYPDYRNEESRYANNVWEGTVSYDPELRIKWKALPPMLERRHKHVADVYGNKLFCLGGLNAGKHLKTVEYFSFSSNKWQQCPDLQCTLLGSKGVVDYVSQQCIIIGGIRDGNESTKLSLFDPQNGLMDIKGELDTERYYHNAILMSL